MNVFSLHQIKVWEIVFLEPLFLYIGILSIFIPIVFLYIWKKRQKISLYVWSDMQDAGFKNSIFYWMKNIVCLSIYVVFFTLFANPQFTNITEKITKDGIDIVIALDISKSMEASDLEPNRISAAKDVIAWFIEEIQSDRLWLVVFAGKPYSSVPLSYDYNLIAEIVENLSTDTLNQNVQWLDGTAIGDALLLSSSILSQTDQQDPQREKIIVLLTDGDANRGVDPILASKLLTEKETKIYTIGVWSLEGWELRIQNGPFFQTQKVPALNETNLREISRISSGKFFRATDNDSLERIFLEIMKLEKTEIETEIEKTYTPAYSYFVWLLWWLFLILATLQFIYKD